MAQNYEVGAFDFTGKNKRLSQGSTLDRTFNLKTGGAGINFSAYGVNPPRCHFRRTIAEATPYLIPTCAWINAAIGQFRVFISASTLTALSTPIVVTAAVTGVYDIEIFTSIDDVVRVMEGQWEMYPEVTR